MFLSVNVAQGSRNMCPIDAFIQACRISHWEISHRVYFARIPYSAQAQLPPPPPPPPPTPKMKIWSGLGTLSFRLVKSWPKYPLP